MITDHATEITFVAYILVTLVIGLVAYHATRNFSDYILGGRKIGAFVTGLSAGASDMSGWLLMGLPGLVFVTGLSESWIAIGLVIGAYLNWLFLAGRLRVHTERNENALTLPDYFTARFDDTSRLLRIFSAIIILMFFTIYCASGIVAAARLFESTFGMAYETALWVGAFATIGYVFVGGFLAISWTDTVQAAMMLFALLLTPLFVILSVGSLDHTFEVIRNVEPAAFDMFRGLPVIAILSALGWGLGYFGQPHILVRFMAAKSAATIPSARRISITWMILCLAGSVGAGFFGIAFFAEHPELAGPVQENGERVFMELTRILFNPWVAGFVLAGILAAIMSTLSCQLLVSSSALTEDFYKAFLRRNASQRELVWVGRFMVLVIALVAISLAYNPESKVFSLVSYAWAGFGAAFGPVVLLSVVWKRMTRNGALAGMIIGALTVVVWKEYIGLGLYEIIPGFAAATVAIIAVSLFGKPPSQLIQSRFDAAETEYRASRSGRAA